MTDQFALELAKYIVEHWETLVVAVPSAMATMVGSTWLAAKYWYEREITHLKLEKTSLDESSKREAAFLNDQLRHKESYAKGVIEVVGQRLLIAEEEPKRLVRILQQQEQDLARLRSQIEKASLQHIQFNGSVADDRAIQELLGDLFEDDPTDPRVAALKASYAAKKMTSVTDAQNLVATLAAMAFLLKIQREKIAGLNIDLNHAHLHYTNSQIQYFKFTKEVMAPLAGGNKHGNDYRELLRRVSELSCLTTKWSSVSSEESIRAINDMSVSERTTDEAQLSGAEDAA